MDERTCMWYLTSAEAGIQDDAFARVGLGLSDGRKFKLKATKSNPPSVEYLQKVGRKFERTTRKHIVEIFESVDLNAAISRTLEQPKQ